MNIEQREVTIAELTKSYSDDGEGGVVGFGGMLDIRPPYQREFVYKDKQRDDVIRSVLAKFPLNVMYWAARPDGTFEVLDGQQRTISICQYVNGEFSIDERYFNNQPEDVQERIRNYKLTVYLCDGEPSEKQEWFKIVNIPGEELTEQELRNAIYPGPWLAAAKQRFSRQNCVAQNLSDGYVKVGPVRQGLLETAIRWVSDDNIEDYMGQYQHASDARELWAHFVAVIEWVKLTFPVERPSLMRDVDWGPVYAKHGRDALAPDQLEAEIHQLLSLKKPGIENVIRKPSGVYQYVLDGDERHLNLRTFDKAQKIAAYERQCGKCEYCGKHCDFRQMEGDHVKPWKEGGLTTDDNLQMLCKPCNGMKGAT